MSATFRAGDRVKVLPKYWSEPEHDDLIHVGMMGTVTEIRLDGKWPVTARFDDVVTECFRHDELKLVEAAPVNVPADPDAEPQPYDMPSPEADALDRIAELVKDTDFTADEDDYGMDMGAAEAGGYAQAMREVAAILRETGRL